VCVPEGSEKGQDVRFRDLEMVKQGRLRHRVLQPADTGGRDRPRGRGGDEQAIPSRRGGSRRMAKAERIGESTPVPMDQNVTILFRYICAPTREESAGDCPSRSHRMCCNETARWMVDFRDYWHDELPHRSTAALSRGGGAPEWHPDFARWLGIDYGASGAMSDGGRTQSREFGRPGRSGSSGRRRSASTEVLLSDHHPR